MRFVIFIILLLHINYSMFIAQVDEQDVFTINGEQIEDINSLTEYVDVVFFGKEHKHKADDDDDCARFFHSIRIDYFFHQPICIARKVSASDRQADFPVYNAGKPSSAYTEIQTPPPELS